MTIRLIDPDDGTEMVYGATPEGDAAVLGAQRAQHVHLAVIGQPDADDPHFRLPISVAIRGEGPAGEIVWFSWSGELRPNTRAQTAILVEEHLENQFSTDPMTELADVDA